jgi:hypothetical protein
MGIWIDMGGYIDIYIYIYMDVLVYIYMYIYIYKNEYRLRALLHLVKFGCPRRSEMQDWASSIDVKLSIKHSPSSPTNFQLVISGGRTVIIDVYWDVIKLASPQATIYIPSAWESEINHGTREGAEKDVVVVEDVSDLEEELLQVVDGDLFSAEGMLETKIRYAWENMLLVPEIKMCQRTLRDTSLEHIKRLERFRPAGSETMLSIIDQAFPRPLSEDQLFRYSNSL